MVLFLRSVSADLRLRETWLRRRVLRSPVRQTSLCLVTSLRTPHWCWSVELNGGLHDEEPDHTNHVFDAAPRLARLLLSS